MSDPSPKLKIDPTDPFGSLAAGPQQFTFLADDTHGDTTLLTAIVGNIAAMARAGVKHLMLEYRATSPDDRALLRRLNSKPPLISDMEIMKYAPKLEATTAKTDEERKASGLGYALMLVEAKKHGLQVHFTGESYGAEFLAEEDALHNEEKLFRMQDRVLAKNYQQSITDPDFWAKHTGTAEEQNALWERMTEYAARLTEFFQRRQEIRRNYEEARISPNAEGAHIDKMIALASGEKAVAIWARHHLSGTRDMNEMMDERLRELYIMARITDPENAPKTKPAPSKVMDLYSARKYEASPETTQEVQESDLKYYVAEKEVEITATGSAKFELAET